MNRAATGAQFADEGLHGMIARMFMRGVGLSAEAVRRRPVIGICSSWAIEFIRDCGTSIWTW